MAQLTDDCFAFSGPLLPIAEMERMIAERVQPVTDTESVSLGAARGRVLAGDMCDRSSGSAASGAPRSSCISAQRLPELISTSVAPAIRWLCESLPGWSRSKPEWACLSVETRKPRPTSAGITLVSSVVLPDPLQPASPMMRMRGVIAIFLFC